MILYNLAALAQQFIASGTHLVAKSVTNTVQPEVVLLLRTSIATLLYIIWLSFTPKRVKKIKKSDIPYFILIGALNIPINQFLFLSGVELTTAPNVSLAYALTPAFVFIIAATFLKEKFTKLKTLGIVLAIAGAVVVVSEKGFDFSSDSLRGDIMVLIASFSWALYTIFGKRLTRTYGAIYTTGLAMGIGLVLFVPVFLISGAQLDPINIPTMNWLQIIYLGAVTSGLGYALWYIALEKIEASKLAVFNNLQPVLTTVLAFAIFGTMPTLFFIMGGVMIIAGVIITQKG